MAVVEATRQTQIDEAPLWLPHHDQIVSDQAQVPAPDDIEGYSWPWRIATVLFSSRNKVPARVGATLAALMVVLLVPTLGDMGWFDLARLLFYQTWTLAILLVATWRVRTVSIPTVAAHWMAGLLSAVLIVRYGAEPLADLAGTGWLLPLLVELTKALPLVIALVVGRKFWRHPGVSDLVILGFAVGAGYATHENALHGRAAASGLKPLSGFLVPTIWQPDSSFVVGHAVWTAIIGCAIGVIVLYRRNGIAVVVAAAGALAVLGDHVAKAGDVSVEWIPTLTRDGKLLATVFVIAAIAAVVLDERRLGRLAARDHLFPTRQQFIASNEDGDPDVFETVLVGRYRRRRNGIHTTIGANTEQWPAMSTSPEVPIAELIRLARIARVDVGAGSSPMGWAPDPDAPDGRRFVGPRGWTPYVVEGTEQTVVVPRARPDASARETLELPDEFWKLGGAALVAVGAFAGLLLVVGGGGEPDPLLSSLTAADTAPPLIATVIGGLAALVSLFSFEEPSDENGTDLGPIDDAPTTRPSECEA